MNQKAFYEILKECCGGKDPAKDMKFVRLYRAPGRCVCNAKIDRNFVIKSKTTKIEKVVGSTCIKKFLPVPYAEYKDSIKPKCEICNQTNHCRIDQFCKECRGGVYEPGQTFRQLVRTRPEKVRWIEKQMPTSDFGMWLRDEGGYIYHGKYKGHTAKEVYKKDRSYAHWVWQLKYPGRGISALAEYVGLNRS